MPQSETLDEARALADSVRSARRATQDGAADAPEDLSALWVSHFKHKEVARQAPMKIHPLPSGGPPIMAVRMPLRMLIRNGLVPDHLTAIVDRYLGLYDNLDPKKSQEHIEDDWAADPNASFAKWNNLLTYIWTTCVVEPSFTSDLTKIGPSGPFDVSEVDFDDKLYLYQWAQGVDESVEAFFQRQVDLMESVGVGDDVPDSARPVVRIRRPGRELAGVADQPVGSSVGVVAQGTNRGNRRKTKQTQTKEPATDRDEATVQREADPVLRDGAAARGADTEDESREAGPSQVGEVGGDRPVRAVRRRRRPAPDNGA